jgi:hypothetical protein
MMKLKMEREGKSNENDRGVGRSYEFNKEGINTMINVYEHINTLISKKQRFDNN